MMHRKNLPHRQSTGKIVGVLKQGISRCLLVMVSLGWGVIRDDLGPVMKRINFLGGLYIALAMVLEIMKEVATAEIKKMSQEEEQELFDVVSILSLVVALIDIIFYLWVIDSLNATMEYLEGLNQTSKLLRYLRLRMFLLLSILFAVAVAVFGIVDAYDQGIVDDDMEWYVNADILGVTVQRNISHTMALTSLLVLGSSTRPLKPTIFSFSVESLFSGDPRRMLENTPMSCSFPVPRRVTRKTVKRASSRWRTLYHRLMTRTKTTMETAGKVSVTSQPQSKECRMFAIHVLASTATGS